MIIFDFDKTLINKDTLFGFYRIVNSDGFVFKIKRLVLLCAAVCYKLKLISNNTLKEVGIKLFLKGKSIDELTDASKRYAEKLELNNLYKNIFLQTPKDRRLIISASPEIYLKQVFPKEKIIGTLLSYKNDRVYGLKANCYANKKLERFKQNYPDTVIEEVYSDSMSDKSLFEKAKRYYIVKNSKILNI
jgi:phosphoserine phosphatase